MLSLALSTTVLASETPPHLDDGSIIHPSRMRDIEYEAQGKQTDEENHGPIHVCSGDMIRVGPE